MSAEYVNAAFTSLSFDENFKLLKCLIMNVEIWFVVNNFCYFTNRNTWSIKLGTELNNDYWSQVKELTSYFITSHLQATNRKGRACDNVLLDQGYRTQYGLWYDYEAIAEMISISKQKKRIEETAPVSLIPPRISHVATITEK
jgi:hypothetical protein